METILSINNLTKKFGPITAVNDLSFTIHKGNVYGILGPNGSGKSTTLGIVLNVVNKTSGDFQWFDGGMSTHDALKKVGAIIERPNFYPYMTAAQNLELVCKIKKVAPDKVDEKLEIVGLLERKNSKFRTFSLGMKQRLAIASALLNDPEILILDEPTNGLDPQGIHQIREIIKKIAGMGTTILLASHLLDEVEKTVFQITNTFLKEKFVHVREVLDERYEKFAELHASGEDTTKGVPTGFSALDMKLSGLQPSDLIILAARPSMGKTSLAMNIAVNAAVKGMTWALSDFVNKSL